MRVRNRDVNDVSPRSLLRGVDVDDDCSLWLTRRVLRRRGDTTRPEDDRACRRDGRGCAENLRCNRDPIGSRSQWLWVLDNRVVKLLYENLVRVEAVVCLRRHARSSTFSPDRSSGFGMYSSILATTSAVASRSLTSSKIVNCTRTTGANVRPDDPCPRANLAIPAGGIR